MPPSKPDVVALVAAIVAHAGIACALASVRARPPRRPEWVEVDMRRPVPAAPKVKLPPPEPPKPRVIPRRVKIEPPPMAPPPNAEPPKAPPKEPPKPVFGATMASTTESDSNVAMPVGNTTMIDPSKSGRGPALPLPAAAAPQGKPAYAPVSELYIKEMPEIDGEACGRTIRYPDEAEQLGVEGNVELRVELDEKGSVHGIKVLKGLGHGLDQAAVYALTQRCKFTPAIATNGKPVAYVIPSYVFRFEIPR
jgi:protein TonB